MKICKIKAKDLAESIGVTKGTMSLFLNGKINLGQDKIEAIMRVLNIYILIKNN